ncbi:OLC1v1018044C1 [Oldenlandia corymbosa var. corymbosa]|uniref:OLC1v1018044C1 n=2 Tax=Oldenlandia corymbosa var. corymbosa TaxID=529605 RepID=A0AAV1EAQ3_OLDCO|nr:OLC1v1018044C1 [Oldenlandia corymbosa var. corymbosa]
MRSLRGFSGSNSKKRSKDARLGMIEVIPERELSLQVLDGYDNENQQMEEEGEGIPLSVSGLPNFRRFNRRYNQSASYTMNEDRVIDRFFKPLGLGFEQELKFPSLFCEKLNGELPDEAILISCKGMWAVKIARCGCHGLLSLSGDGWTSYIFHHDLSVYDMIWFEETDQMVFRTHVFDSSACEKKFPDNLALVPIVPTGHRTRSKAFAKCSENEFTAVIEAHHVNHNYVTFPAEFLRANDELRWEKKAILVNAYGHAWEVELSSLSDEHQAEVSVRNKKLCSGWRAFFVANKLKAGDICIFEVDHLSTLKTSSNIILKVQVLRSYRTIC